MSEQPRPGCAQRKTRSRSARVSEFVGTSPKHQHQRGGFLPTAFPNVKKNRTTAMRERSRRWLRGASRYSKRRFRLLTGPVTIACEIGPSPRFFSRVTLFPTCRPAI